MEKEKRKGREIGLAMIAANNHYVGFGPGTAICLEIWFQLKWTETVSRLFLGKIMIVKESKAIPNL